MSARDPDREALGLALAYLERDNELVAEILRGYSFPDDDLGLLVGVLELVGLERDEDELTELLYEVALAGAGR